MRNENNINFDYFKQQEPPQLRDEKKEYEIQSMIDDWIDEYLEKKSEEK